MTDPQPKMIMVGVELFTENFPLPADVYTRLPSGQYLLVGKKGEKSNFQSLHMTAQKKAELYVRGTDYDAVIQFNLALAKTAVGKTEIPTNLKLNLITGLADSAINDLVDRKIMAGSYERVKQLSGFIKDTVSQVSDVDKLLDLLSKLPKDSASHGMATAAISLLICEQMEIQSKPTLEKVALGALLHDIGLKEIPDAVLKKPRADRTVEETTHYESHTMRGVEMLQELREIPSDVLAIILEHHENAIGMGYPRRIRDVKMNPLARIVAVANYFMELLHDTSGEHLAKTPDEAIYYMETTLGQPFNKQVFAALKEVVFAHRRV
ncbi:HD-GYP domain-containing protein [Bdellovibrio sp. HCB185ZH]|uniref:HD-GYP domain-containing protein n=1 Tax=Bdellovibrio sp. HCB185ZH TaxID=3394235 RepID=UPI0039A5CA16